MKQKRVSIKGILLGFLIDVGVSIGGTIVIAIVLMIQNGIPENPESIMTPCTYGLSLVVAFLGTTLGGFVTGKIAKKSEVFNASLMGLLSVLTAIPFMNGPLLYDVAGYGLTIPFAILGGYLAIKKNTSNQRTHSITASGGSE